MFSGKIVSMEEGVQYLSAAEAAEYGEFVRSRKETEIALTIKKICVDASRRETDKSALQHACEYAKKLQVASVLVSPVNLAAARRRLAESGIEVCCVVGGTGESLVSVKKTEAKKAVRQGAREIRLIPCYSALTGGNLAYLKREIKKVKKAVKKGALVLSLEDHSLTADDVAFGVRAAREGKADGVCVRGETSLLLRALEASGGKFRTDASCVENAEQLRMLFRAGAYRVATDSAEKIAEELYATLREEDPKARQKTAALKK